MVLRMVSKKKEGELVPSLLNLTKNLENFSKNKELTEFAQRPPFPRKVTNRHANLGADRNDDFNRTLSGGIFRYESLNPSY